MGFHRTLDFDRFGREWLRLLECDAPGMVLLVLAKLFVVVAVFVLRVLFFLLLILCDMILLGYNIFQSLELVV